MIKLKRLLMEDDKSPEELKQHFATNFSEAKAAFDSNRCVLYRGKKKTSDFEIVDPKLRQRKSLHNKNYVNLFLTISPQFQDFPARTRSAIFSSSGYDATAYGSLYYVFPENGAKIAIGPTGDFLSSWFGIQTAQGKKPLSVEMIDLLFTQLGIQETVEDISHKLKTVGVIDVDKAGLIIGERRPSSVPMIEYISDLMRQKNQTLWDVLVELMSSKNFRMENISQLTIDDSGREMWTEAKCLLVETSYYDKII